MSTAVITPTTARGALRAPPSKSYTHRGLVAGFLTGAPYLLENPNDCDDTRATLAGVAGLGAKVRRTRAGWRIAPGRPDTHPAVRTVDCGSSGSTLRFLTPLAALGPRVAGFAGSEELARRPMEELLRILVRAGARLRRPWAKHSLPFLIAGPIRAGNFQVPGGTSSQYTSGLLMALPTLRTASTLRVRGRAVSAPYVAATLATMEAHGVQVEARKGVYSVPGSQRYEGAVFRVPGDASAAAYLWTAGALTGGAVAVRGIDPRWPQADWKILDALADTGARVARTARSVEVRGPASRGTRLDLTDAPDLAPLVGVLGALTGGGPTVIRGAPQARFKESDRRAGTARLARAFGAHVRLRARTIEIRPGLSPRRVRLRRLTDHRLTMSAAIGALALERPSEISDASSVNKSFPGFWDALRELGAEVRIVA